MKLKQNVGAREVHLLNSLGTNTRSLQRLRFCPVALKQIWLIASILQRKLYHSTSPARRWSIVCSLAEVRHRYGHTSRKICESPKRGGTAPVTRPADSLDRKAPGQTSAQCQNRMDSSRVSSSLRLLSTVVLLQLDPQRTTQHVQRSNAAFVYLLPVYLQAGTS